MKRDLRTKKPKNIMFAVFLFFGFLVFWFALINIAFAAFGQEKYVRIAILQDAQSLYLKVKGSFEIRDISGERLILRGRNIKSQVVKSDRQTINISGKDISLGGIKILPKGWANVYINNRAFRGRVNIIRKGNNRLLIVNELDMEDYVKGILCHEVAPWWPMESLKAQAIIARSYAVYQRQLTRDKDFDLTNDIYSQVYGGKTSEKWRTNRAVDLTRGKILTFEGKAFPSYYHATCGGHTEDAKQLWKIDLAPLKGVACNFCLNSPHFSWEKQMPLQDIASKLMEKAYNSPKIENIEISGRDASGRITFLKIEGGPRILEISAKDFRQAMDPNVIRSANFTLSINSDGVYFKGLGWGHGVGACQWGMYFMAKSGYSHLEILKYYFPQTELTNLK